MEGECEGVSAVSPLEIALQKASAVSLVTVLLADSSAVKAVRVSKVSSANCTANHLALSKQRRNKASRHKQVCTSQYEDFFFSLALQLQTAKDLLKCTSE